MPEDSDDTGSTERAPAPGVAGPNPDLAREQDVDVPHELLDEALQEAEYPADEGDEG